MLSSPHKPKRHYTGKIADPNRWYEFAARPGDIVVSTPPKSGTTWTQGILALLLSGDPDVDAAISRRSPWIDITDADQDARIAALNAQNGRRQVKTHTPLDGIPLWSELRYISVFRHPIDVHFSFRRHVENMSEDVLGNVYPPDIQEGFRIFLEGDHRDGASLVSIIDHFRSVLEFAGHENVLCLHYSDMTRDLDTSVHQIAKHIAVEYPPALMGKLVASARFENMKKNAERFAISAREGFWRKDSDFFDSGTSQKWLGVLKDSDLAVYDARMAELLDESERNWLENGCGTLRTAFAG